MSARHGTDARYSHAGCRCVECTKAHRIRREAWVLGTLRGVKYRLPALGTSRRLQALAAIGWSGHEIATRLGHSRQGVARLRVTVGTVVYAATAEQVGGVYRDLSMTPGPSTRTRRMALAAGWAPPLAWDDIDDPDATPDLGEPSRGLDLDEWARLVRYGTNPTAAAARCGVRLSAVEQAAYRHDRPDILALLRRAA